MIAPRLAGAALVAASGALLGQARVREEKRRMALLAALCDGLGTAADEVEALQTPLPVIFGRLSNGGAGCFFSAVLRGAGDAQLSHAWRAACADLPLGEAELAVLASLADGLGKFGAGAQCAELRLARGRLLESLALRRESALREGRMSVGLGASLGAMAAVLLF